MGFEADATRFIRFEGQPNPRSRRQLAQLGSWVLSRVGDAKQICLRRVVFVAACETNKKTLKTNLQGFPRFEEAWAGRTGLEPATSGVTGRRYNRLNYHPIFTFVAWLDLRRCVRFGVGFVPCEGL